MQIDYSRRIFGLDIMRAIAILMVVFSHTLWIVPDAKGLIPDILSLAGVLGVEIFFVLSGFLIGRIVYKIFVKDDFNFNKIKYFWIRRWFRTLPNYYLVLILNICIAIYFGNVLPQNLWQYFGFLQNFAWEMPLFFSESWSLPIEEFAYIVGPLLLYLLFYFKINIDRKKLFALITLVIVIIFLVTKVMYTFSIPNSDMNFWNVNLKAITIYRIDAIYYGALASYVAMINPVKWLKLRWISFFLGGLIFIVLNFIIPTKNVYIETHPVFWNVLYLPINSIAIALCLPLLASIKSAPKFVLIPITYISLISYSMYLLHYSIILQILKHYIPSEGLANFDVFVYITVYILSTILLAFVLYRIYEKPMMDIRDKPLFRSINKA
ncbi:MAG: acyltransferase [Flavobacteriaceae bacterium]|nr:acyltransferase [Flavobacteriaceae bacterium]